MYIHEAIEKAGEGGKIRRETWVSPRYIEVPPKVKAFIWEDNTVKSFLPMELTADDWEVVESEPIVEIIIKGPVQSGKTIFKGRIATMLEEMGVAVECPELKQERNSENIAELSAWEWDMVRKAPVKLTEEISRPEKTVHTFEGVRVDCNHTYVFPVFKGGRDGDYNTFCKFIDDGKTYRMTFEEM